MPGAWQFSTIHGLHCIQTPVYQSQQWIERQLKKQVPADKVNGDQVNCETREYPLGEGREGTLGYYFLVTFTVPKELRTLVWQHQRTLYDLMIQCSWSTLKTFAQNDKALQGDPGAIAVLHTHSRRLDFHPHVHVVIPAGTIDRNKRLWRTKKGKNKKPFLFHHTALAKVFRARMLEVIVQEGLTLPEKYPEKWVVDCKYVGSGEKALVYLGRYLYRGVIQEKDIIACENGNVTFRYIDSKTGQTKYRTLKGEAFLWLLLQHVLPKGFRRARNFGFLHPNSKRLIQVLQLICKLDPTRALAWFRKRPPMKCTCCGGVMKIIKTRIRDVFADYDTLAPS